MEKTIKLDKIISGAFVSWQVCTNCQNNSKLEFLDDNTSYFLLKNPGGDVPKQIAFSGSKYSGGANLRIHFYDMDYLKIASSEGAVVDWTGKTVAYVYNFCIEDTEAGTDFNDISINIVAWEKSENQPTNSEPFAGESSSTLAIDLPNLKDTPMYFVSYFVSSQSGIAGDVKLYNADRTIFDFKKPTTTTHDLIEMGHGFTAIPANDKLTLTVNTSEQATYPVKYIPVRFPILDNKKNEVGEVRNILFETGADDDYNDFYVTIFIWRDKN
jgi:hypothetical protein